MPSTSGRWAPDSLGRQRTPTSGQGTALSPDGMLQTRPPPRSPPTTREGVKFLWVTEGHRLPGHCPQPSAGLRVVWFWQLEPRCSLSRSPLTAGAAAHRHPPPSEGPCPGRFGLSRGGGNWGRGVLTDTPPFPLHSQAPASGGADALSLPSSLIGSP